MITPPPLPQSELRNIHLTELGQRVAILLHEIKNPLSVILTGLSSLKEETLSERNHLRISLAQEEALRLKRMVSRSLMYVNHPPLEKGYVELKDLLQQVCELMQASLITSQGQIRLHSAVPEVWIWGDRDGLKQVFINLIENAYEAAPDEEIACSLTMNESQRQVHVEVHNGGDPIMPEVLSQLTKPFVTTKPCGSGIGLAVVKQLVEAHNGELRLMSSRVAGTTVTVCLPTV